MRKSFRNLRVRARIGFLLLAQSIEKSIFYLLILFLPTQFGRHFWPQFSNVYGIRIDYLSPTLYTTDILVFTLFIIYFLREIDIFKKIKSRLLRYLPFILLVLFVFVGIIMSKSPVAGWYGLLKLLEFVFLGIYVSKNINNFSFNAILLTLSVSVVFESLLSIAQFIHKGSLNGILYFFGERFFNSQTPGIANALLNGELVLRPYGTFSHPNVLAGYLLIAMTLIFLNLRLTIKSYEKIFFLGSVFLGSSAIFLSMSRIVIVLWLIIFCFGLMRYSKRIFGFNRLTSYFPIGLALLMFVFFIFLIRFRFIDFKFSDESIVVRETLTKSYLFMTEKNPVFGVGLNNYLQNSINFQKPTSLFLYMQPAHNIYLLILSQAGIMGGSFSLWFIYRTYKKIMYSKSKIKEGLFIALSSVLFIGFFDHYFLTLQQGQLLFSFLLGFCWSLNKK